MSSQAKSKTLTSQMVKKIDRICSPAVFFLSFADQVFPKVKSGKIYAVKRQEPEETIV